MTRRRTRGATRRAWDICHISQLAHGFDYFRDAWGDEPYDDETRADMRRAYARHGDEVEEIVRRQHGARARSWAAENLFG